MFRTSYVSGLLPISTLFFSILTWTGNNSSEFKF